MEQNRRRQNNQINRDDKTMIIARIGMVVQADNGMEQILAKRDQAGEVTTSTIRRTTVSTATGENPFGTRRRRPLPSQKY